MHHYCFEDKWECHGDGDCADLRKCRGTDCSCVESTCEKSSTVSTDPPTPTPTSTDPPTPTSTDPPTPTPTDPPTPTSTDPPTPTEPPCNCGKANPGDADSERIIGGTEAQKNEFPWVVNVRSTKEVTEDATGTSTRSSSCGGAIISPKIVLTAGHCIVKDEDADVKAEYIEDCYTDTNTNTDKFKCYKTIQVLAGVHKITRRSDDAKKTIDVKKAILHKDYKPKDNQAEGSTGVIHDLAILQLEDDIEFTAEMSPICLPSDVRPDKYKGEKATVAGWGRTDGMM